MEELSSESMMWVKVVMKGGEVLHVGVVYIVPEASVFRHEGLEALDCLAKGLHELREMRGERNVMVIGDVNGRIGELSVEVEVEGEMVVMPRQSADKTVNERGRTVMGLLQAFGMVVMNGLHGEDSGKATCKGASVVDWMAVGLEMKEECGGMRVEQGWMGEGKREDHAWLRLEWEAATVNGVERDPEESCEEKERAGRGGQKGRGRCNVRRGRREGWEGLVWECDRTLRRWCEEWDRRVAEGKEDVVEASRSWLEAHDRVVGDSIGWQKKRRGKKQSWYGREVSKWNREMRELMKEWMRGGGGEMSEGLSEKRREVRRRRQKEIRKKKAMRLRQKMREIEAAGKAGRGEHLLNALQEWSAAPRVALGGDRERMRGEDGEWVVGEKMTKAWRDTFEKVGKDLEEEGGFDEKVKGGVEGVVDGWKSDWPDERIEMEVDGVVKVTSLDGEVCQWEVRRAIRKLKNGKAGGVDGVLAEILKKGGEWMERSVWRLCWLVFRGERVPVEWLKAIKVPVRKKGSGVEFQHYRGVTLLSVVGKVFGMVVEARLREFCESRGILNDAQFGFRQKRACRDALLVVSEVVERRGGERVFAGFLDIAKAYPSVWRKGLWFKMWEVGVRGRMWRVLRTLYSKCEVAVRVGGVADDWYEEFVGVREGCVVSPLLFAIYINDLPQKLEEQGGGRGYGWESRW